MLKCTEKVQSNWSTIANLLREQFTVRHYRNANLKSYSARGLKDRLEPVIDWSALHALEDQGFRQILSQIEYNPRSIYRSQKLFEGLSLFRPGRIKNVKISEAVQSGVSLAWKIFSKPKDVKKLKPLDVSLSMIKMITTNPKASAGLTVMGAMKGSVVNKAYVAAMRILDEGKAPKPCLAYSRTQANDKTRLVWGYPYEMTIIEGKFARTLYDIFTRRDTPMAFGKTTMHLGTRITSMANRKRFCYSVDMSKYDASIANNLIMIAFKILKTWFEIVSDEDKRAWELIVKYFICTPIVMPDQNLYLGKRHGVPSGSYFTQIIDSIVNVIIAGTLSHVFNLYLSPDDLQVLGDDLIFFSDRDVELETLARKATQIFGVQFNASKSMKSSNKDGDTIHYLGRDWNSSTPDIPLEEILQKVVFPERFRCYSKNDTRKDQEVKNLLLSYAITYRSGGKLIGIDTKDNIMPLGMLEYRWYQRRHELGLDQNHLSGLTQFYLREGILSSESGSKSLFHLSLL